MTFQERYHYSPQKDLLGKGGFARVYKAKDTLLDREVAIKIFNSTDKGQYTVVQEIKKVIKLQHPNLLRYYDVAMVSNTNSLGEAETIEIGVMEYANSGDLKQFALKNPKSPLLFDLLEQVLSGLEYLHQKGIIHRDLKPQNILLLEEDGKLCAKISDFGISKSMESGTNSASMAIGTIEYMAPEQFNPAKYGINGKISTNVDLWSFGIMVHELINNKPLFGQRNGNTTAEQIMNAILSQQLPSDIENLPEPYRTVVKKCLTTDANKRVQKAVDIIKLLKPLNQEENNYSKEINNNYNDETAVIDKSFLNSLNNQTDDNGGETKVIDVKTINNDIPLNNKIENAPAKKKTNTVYYIFLALIVLGAGAWMMFKNSAVADPILNANENIRQKDYPNAILILKPLVDKGDTANATYKTALPLLINALVATKDTMAALPYLQKGALINNTESNFLLGFLYFKGILIAKDYNKALALFTKAAHDNDNRAESYLGNMYFMGHGVQQNYNQAIEHYFKAANQGNAIGMYGLGLAYIHGLGVMKNVTEAEKWLNKVVTQNEDPTVVSAAKVQLQDLENSNK